MSTFSINATYTELVELLGFVLRNKLGYKMIYFPHWNFRVTNTTLARSSTYLGKGRFFASLKDGEWSPRGPCDDDVEVRIECELSDEKGWVVRLWLKFPNHTIRSYCFEKSSSEETPQESSEAVSAHPPAEIAFW